MSLFRCVSTRIWPIVFLIFSLLFLAGCSSRETGSAAGGPAGLRVITTLFPLYDFARAIVRDKGEVSLLLHPGAEPHGFEPRPDDLLRIGRSSVFVYTGPVMEPWAAKIIGSADRGKTRIVEAAAGVKYLPIGDGHAHGGKGTERLDPHVWLDFGNDLVMVDNLLAGIVAADPVNAAFYRANAAALKDRLRALDSRYRTGLAECATKTLLHGGHFTFGYLARRYGLTYRSLSGVSSEAEPSAADMAAMVKSIRNAGVRHVFAEELLSPRMTEILAAESGVGVLRLHGGHNLGKDDLAKGVTFIDLMDGNLQQLQKGLACRTK